MLSRRRSDATLPTSTASRRSAPEYASASPMLCVTRNRLRAAYTASFVSRASVEIAREVKSSPALRPVPTAVDPRFNS